MPATSSHVKCGDCIYEKSRFEGLKILTYWWCLLDEYFAGFLGAGLSSLMDPGLDKSKASLVAVTARICHQSGENVISGILYALLGVSAMARVCFLRSICSYEVNDLSVTVV